MSNFDCAVFKCYMFVSLVQRNTVMTVRRRYTEYRTSHADKKHCSHNSLPDMLFCKLGSKGGSIYAAETFQNKTPCCGKYPRKILCVTNYIKGDTGQYNVLYQSSFYKLNVHSLFVRSFLIKHAL